MIYFRPLNEKWGFLIFLQLLNYESFKQMSDENRIRLIASQPIRGRILDRNGIVLADSRVKYSLIIKPQSVNDINWEKHKLIVSDLLNVDNNLIEIFPKDTATKANQTLKSAFELSEMGVKIVIGPVFYESLTYLDEMKNLTFLSLTNKTLDLPKNVISAGINSTSQFNTIKKFLETNQIQKTIFLTPISFPALVILSPHCLAISLSKTKGRFIAI